jgi:glutathione-regulated potassium-efflux system protein KefB
MPTEPSAELVKTVVLLAAGVLAVPLFKRLRLGSVLAYLLAGVVIGPFGLRVFREPEHILKVAELGVVMFLFIIGLEMRPRRLWNMRRQIFGSGVVQVVVCGALLTGLGTLAGYRPAVAFIAAMGFVLTSTATVMQLLDERGETLNPAGQRIVSILLLEDLAIVPLLAIVAVLSPEAGGPAAGSRAASNWLTVGVALAAVTGLVAVSRWLLNPMFEILARAKARELMTAAALLVVLGAALAMQWSGLSMAMGAFVAGVMLSESSFRNELEADIEPFRGILLGLFFMSVGMSLDLGLVIDAWAPILLMVAGYMAVKALGVYAVARLGRAGRRESLVRATLMAQGGEFAFVLYAAAGATGLLDARTAAVLSAVVIVSIGVTPLLVPLLRLIPARRRVDLDGVEAVEDAADVAASVLLIGFGRFGQIASQALLARGIDLAIIDSDPDMIRAAAGFGFKVYYGDGARLDVLHASGGAQAKAILVCVDDRRSTERIVELVKHEWPLVPVLARSYDRQHAIALIKANVDFQIRETFESALKFSIATLKTLGATPEDAATVCEEIRRRDAERLELQVAGDLRSGRDLILRDHRMTPTPLTTPRRAGEPLSEETAEALGERPPAE